MDKLSLIKKILETDPATDRRIMALIEAVDAEQCLPEKTRSKDTKSKIHIEERDCLRKCVLWDAAINTGHEKIRAHVEDVSASGAFIRTEKKIARGEDIAIRLMTEQGEEFAFISNVVRVEEKGIGVRIKTINSVHQERFVEFVRKL